MVRRKYTARGDRDGATADGGVDCRRQGDTVGVLRERHRERICYRWRKEYGELKLDRTHERQHAGSSTLAHAKTLAFSVHSECSAGTTHETLASSQ